MRFQVLLAWLFLMLSSMMTPITAQGIYPLAKGNIWQYWDYDFLNGQVTWIYGWTTKVTGDTLMPNGKTYAILYSDRLGNSGTFYMRQDGPRVIYGYDESHPDSAYVLYDFSKTTGDTMRLVLYTSMTTLTTVAVDDSDYFFGLKRRYQEYLTEVLRSSAYQMDRVADGFGMVYQEAEAGTTWFLRGAIINGVSYGTVVSVNDRPTSVPTGFLLDQNYPNPFNPTTTIGYALPRRTHVVLAVYNILGEQVAELVNVEVDAGFHRIRFDASGLSSGVYFYRLSSPEYVQTRRFVLVR